MAIKRAIKAGDKSIISFKKAIKVGAVAQLFDKSKFPVTTTENGVTFTNNGDGSITAVGTSTAFIAGSILLHSKLGRLKKGHKYLISSGHDDNINNYVAINFYNDNGQYIKGYSSFSSPIFTFEGLYYTSNIGGIYIYIRQIGTTMNDTFTPQLFDLTEMFGAGHEPATVAEFKAKFPDAYYPYQRAVLTVYNKVVRPGVRKGEVIQLLNAGDYDATVTNYYGTNYTNNNDGSWTLSGVPTQSNNYNILYHYDSSKIPIIKDRVYLLIDNRVGKIADDGNATVQILNSTLTTILGTSNNQEVGYYFKTATETTMCYMRIRGEVGVTYDNVKLTPQLFDLTAMYGKGNEPKTVAEFRKNYPESYYPYNPIQTKNLFDIRKYTGLINSQLKNVSASYFVKNLTQNSLKIRMGGYGLSAFIKEPIVLPAGTYTFSCDCDYDAINNRGGVHLSVGKKNESGTGISSIAQNSYRFVHRLVLTFTLAEETEVYLSLQGDGGPPPQYNYTNLNNVFFNIQLEKGSVATDYVPHDYI